MTSRSSRYAVDRPVDPSRSPPYYRSPSLDETDSPYSAENSVQPRHSASYNTGGNLFALHVSTKLLKLSLFYLSDKIILLLCYICRNFTLAARYRCKTHV